MSTSDNKIKGDEYEKYVRDTLRNEYDDIWLWKDVPEYILFDNNIIKDYDYYCRNGRDIGIDVVAKKGDNLYFIQCKNHQKNVCINDLAGFFFYILTQNVDGILYYSNGISDNIIKTLNENLTTMTQKIYLKHLPFDNNTIITNNTIFECKNNFELRDYQLAAIEKLKNSTISILVLPCGSGKTYVSYIISQDYDNIILLAPLKELTKQLLTRMIDFYKNDNKTHSYILISSDADGSRQINQINNKIKKRNIIACTYDSCDILCKIIGKLKNVIIIVDEYHNLSKTNLTDPNNHVNKIINSGNKILYLSATPNLNIKHDSIYKYEWNQAISKKYICDFNITIPTNEIIDDAKLQIMLNLLENMNNENNDGKDQIYFNEIHDEIDEINEIQNITINRNNNDTKYIKISNNVSNKFAEKIKEVHTLLIKKAYFILKSLLFNGNKKCIIFLTTIKKTHLFKKILIGFTNLLNIDVEYNIVTCDTSKKDRENILFDFRNSKKLSIILNVHILDEGIDIAECDSVFVANPNYNIENLVQRLCRCNRIIAGKTKCNMYMWCQEKKVEHIFKYLESNINKDIHKKITMYNPNENKIKNAKNKINDNKVLKSVNNKVLKSVDKIFDLSSNVDKIFDLSSNVVSTCNKMTLLYFEDFKNVIGKNIDMDTAKEWINNSIVWIINNGESFFIIKNRKIDHITKLNRISYKVIKKEALMTTLDVECNIENPEFDFAYWSEHKDDKNKNVLIMKKMQKYLFTTLGFDKGKNKGFVEMLVRTGKILTYDSIEFYPFLERKGIPNLDGKFNIFGGFPLEKVKLTSVIDFTKSALYKHIKEEFMDNNEDELNHFLDHIADMIQDPANIKTNGHLFVTSQGYDKGLLAEFVFKLIGQDHGISFENTDAYFNNFNVDQGNKILKLFEQVSSKGAAFKNHDRLKADQSKKFERFESKGLDPYKLMHCARYWYYSNNKDCLYIEDANRRITYHHVKNTYANNIDYFETLWQEIRDIQFCKNAFEFFATRKYTFKSVSTCFDNKFKKERKEQNLSKSFQFLKEFAEDGCPIINKEGSKIKCKDLHKAFSKWCIEEGTHYCLATFRTQLKKIDITECRLRINHNSDRCYVLDQNILREKFATLLKDPNFQFNNANHIDENIEVEIEQKIQNNKKQYRKIKTVKSLCTENDKNIDIINNCTDMYIMPRKKIF